MGVLALRQVKSDDPVLVAGDDPPLATGEQVERQTVVAVADPDREPKLVEPEDQAALGGLGNPILGDPDSVGIRRPGPCQGAAEAQTEGRSRIGDPVASAAVEVRTDGPIRLDGDHGALFTRVPDRAAASHAHRVLEKQLSGADFTPKGTHDRQLCQPAFS